VTAAAGVTVDAYVAAAPQRAAFSPAGGTLFQQPWWLDAVAPGGWSAARVVRDGELVGYLPYVSNGIPGLRFSTQPALTPTLGPWVRAADDDYRHALAGQHAVLADLILALPRFGYIAQRCPPAFTNGLPFVWAGFDVRVGYTYRLFGLDDLDRVWAGFETQRRRAAQKARRTLEVAAEGELEALLRLSDLTLRRAGIRIPYRHETIRRIDLACRGRGACSVLTARDVQGVPRAAVYLVHDDETTYYLLGGADDRGRAAGAMTLLLWEAIRCAAARGTVFDFEGSMLETIERFFRSFGAQQVPYLMVSRTSALARPIVPLARAVRRFGRSVSWQRR
jgi:GNAT acetyltransferase-like protein